MDITLLLVSPTTVLLIVVGFNPCFNGYYTSTANSNAFLSAVKECFNPCFNGYYTSTQKAEHFFLLQVFVSILVLMDITLLLVQSKAIGITRTQQQ